MFSTYKTFISLQDELMSSLEQALTIPDLPEISQTILNLAEFMEHCDKGPLPLDPVLLGEQAVKCRAYAKALHYKEDEFHREATVPVVESLMSINNKLGQKEAATGLLEWGRKNLQVWETAQLFGLFIGKAIILTLSIKYFH